jgi:S-adenosylmethionine/arginine decarboxylase-like enzyme
MAWGYELVLDCYDADQDLIRSRVNIEAFAKVLVKKIDMVAYGNPLLVHFGSDDKMGFTLVQLIETSNITAHFSEDTGNFYLNVFSCKEFDTEVVVEVVKHFFGPKTIDKRFLERGISNEEET